MSEAFISGGGGQKETLTYYAARQFTSSDGVSTQTGVRYKLFLMDAAGNIIVAYIENGAIEIIYKATPVTSGGVSASFSTSTYLKVQTDYYIATFHIATVT